MKKECSRCKKIDYGMKTGWTNAYYCSEQCERSAVSDLHGSMPGAGPVPYPGWVPSHIATEISQRWNDC